jgi:hypothetical protein
MEDLESALSILARQRRGDLLRAHSQTRMTTQPLRRSLLVTRRSRARVQRSLSDQTFVFVAGSRFRQSCPCQKQPSTNRAIRSFVQTKSGLPTIGAWRRQPVIRCFRNREASLSSVVRLFLLRMRDISCDRGKPPKLVISAIELFGQRDRTALESELLSSARTSVIVIGNEISQS